MSKDAKIVEKPVYPAPVYAGDEWAQAVLPAVLPKVERVAEAGDDYDKEWEREELEWYLIDIHADPAEYAFFMGVLHGYEAGYEAGRRSVQRYLRFDR